MRRLPIALLAFACGGHPAAVELATAPAPWTPDPTGISVEVRPEALAVGGRTVMSLSAGGVPADDASGLLLQPVHDALIAAPPADRERIRLAVAGTVPHGTVLALIFTAAQAGGSEFELEVRRPDGTPGALRLCPPAQRGVDLAGSDWCLGGEGVTGEDLGWVVWSEDPSAPVPHLVILPSGDITLVDSSGVPTPLPAHAGTPDLEALGVALTHLHAVSPRRVRLDLLVDRAVPWAWVVAVMGTAQQAPASYVSFPLIALVAT